MAKVDELEERVRAVLEARDLERLSWTQALEAIHLGMLVRRDAWDSRAIGLRRPLSQLELGEAKTKGRLCDVLERPFLVLVVIRRGEEISTRWHPYYDDFAGNDWYTVRRIGAV